MIPFRIESWIWYALGVIVIAGRTVSRILFFKSVKKLQVDDYLMFVALCTNTVFMVAINIASNTSSNLLAPGENVSQFSPQEKKERVYGSKLVLVVEQMQCCTVWLIKACLLIMYDRLTNQLRANRWVRLLAVYSAVGFLTMEILYFGVWCQPLYNYWALPTPNIQCSAATHHLITNACFNISSDIMMLSIAFTLFIRSILPWNRKIILCGVFGLSAFVILSAVLNKYYSFTHPFGNQWTYWYVRESSTAILIANLPFTWTLLRRLFNLKAFAESSNRSDVGWRSRRSTLGRQATAVRAGIKAAHTRSNVRLTYERRRHGSGSLRTSLDLSPPSTAIIKMPEMALKKYDGGPQWQHPDDIDLAIEPWDSSAKSDSRTDYIGSMPGSPVKSTSRQYSRRLRDEEAQYAMQDVKTLNYYELDDDLDVPDGQAQR